MKTTKTNTGIKVTAGVKGGGYSGNHSRGTLRVRTGLKAGGQLLQNHSGTLLVVS